ncbi:MAG: hypothetical protein V7720_06425 [Halioglobus sp.]
MKISDVNEYVQTVTALGAIVALLAVGYEIRQSNMIATRETLSTNWSNAVISEHANLESGIAKTRAKAMTNADDLTLEEMIDLDSFLTAFVYDYHHNYIVLELNESPELVEKGVEELVADVPFYFGSSFARAWFVENKAWMHPAIMTAITRGLKDEPIGSGLAYYQRIQALASTLE